MRRAGKIPAVAILCTAFRQGPIALMLLFCLCGFAQQAVPTANRFRISGTVVNSVSGQALAQVRVFLSLPQQIEDREVVMTGPDGHFLFDNVPAGKYALGAAKPGFMMQAFEAHEMYSSAIVVGPGVSAENLLFRIHPAAVISGQVVDEQNEPVREAQVLLLKNRLQGGKRSVRQAGQTTTDDRGQYRFGSLAPGTYFVVLSARPWYAPFTAFANSSDGGAGQTAEPTVPRDVTYPITYYPGATDLSQATPLTLAAGDHVSADFSVTPVRSLHIHVRTPKPNATEGCSVVATPEASQGVDLRLPIPLQTTMNKPGEVDVSGLPPGQYRLQIVFPGREASTYTQDVDLQSDIDIDPGAGDQSRIISGSVRTQGESRLPPGAGVMLRSNSGQIAMARITPNGQFQFDAHAEIPSGSYEIALNTDNMFVVSVSGTGASVSGRTIQIQGSTPIRLSIVVAQGFARIEGMAVSGDDKPIAGAMILLMPADAANNEILIRRDQSDSDGTFTLPSVVPGHYTLLAIRNGWDLEWMNPAMLKPYLQNAESIDVQRSGKYNLKVLVQ